MSELTLFRECMCTIYGPLLPRSANILVTTLSRGRYGRLAQTRTLFGLTVPVRFVSEPPIRLPLGKSLHRLEITVSAGCGANVSSLLGPNVLFRLKCICLDTFCRVTTVRFRVIPNLSQLCNKTLSMVGLPVSVLSIQCLRFVVTLIMWMVKFPVRRLVMVRPTSTRKRAPCR